MRRLFFAAVATLPLVASETKAQAFVHDPASNALRIAEAGRAIQQAIQQYRMLQATWSALSHATDVQGVAAALGGPARMHSPGAGQITDLIAGSGSLWGTANRLMTMGRYMDVGNETPWAREMQRRELVTANAKAVAEGGMQNSEQSIFNLSSLLARITGSQDVTEVSAVNGAVAVEQQNIQHHQSMIDQVRLMLMGEERVERQRAEQMQWESAQMLLESTAPAPGEFR